LGDLKRRLEFWQVLREVAFERLDLELETLPKSMNGIHVSRQRPRTPAGAQSARVALESRGFAVEDPPSRRIFRSSLSCLNIAVKGIFEFASHW
jgi:hypothetical protein